MKRYVTAILKIPIEIDEKGMINMMNDHTQSTITEFDANSLSQPKDNVYRKIMDYLKEHPEPPLHKSVETPLNKSVETPLQKSVETPLHKSVETPLQKSVETPLQKSVEDEPVFMVLSNEEQKIRKNKQNHTFKTYSLSNTVQQLTRRNYI